MGLESGGMGSWWSDPLGDPTVRPWQGLPGVQGAGQGVWLSTKVDEKGHELERTALAVVGGGGRHNQGGHEAVQVVGCNHRKGQAARGWDVASGGQLCGAGGGPEVAVGCIVSRAE